MLGEGDRYRASAYRHPIQSQAQTPGLSSVTVILYSHLHFVCTAGVYLLWSPLNITDPNIRKRAASSRRIVDEDRDGVAARIRHGEVGLAIAVEIPDRYRGQARPHDKDRGRS